MGCRRPSLGRGRRERHTLQLISTDEADDFTTPPKDVNLDRTTAALRTLKPDVSELTHQAVLGVERGVFDQAAVEQ